MAISVVLLDYKEENLKVLMPQIKNRWKKSEKNMR